MKRCIRLSLNFALFPGNPEYTGEYGPLLQNEAVANVFPFLLFSLDNYYFLFISFHLTLRRLCCFLDYTLCSF